MRWRVRGSKLGSGVKKEGRDLTERGRERRARGQFLEGKEEQAP